MTMTTSSIKSLQIGMHWFPERAGGLDRMYYSLVGALIFCLFILYDTSRIINAFGYDGSFCC